VSEAKRFASTVAEGARRFASAVAGEMGRFALDLAVLRRILEHSTGSPDPTRAHARFPEPASPSL